MTAPANLDFSTPTPGYPGRAASWTFTEVSSFETWAIFTHVNDAGFEGFEQDWDSNEAFTRALTISNTTAAEFLTEDVDGKRVENFEELWDANQDFLTSLDGFVTAAEFSTPYAAFSYEAFEEGWDSNEDFETSLTSVTAAEFNAGLSTVEHFEESWRSNESFITSLSSTTAALFHVPSGTEAFNNFEAYYSEKPFTVDLTVNLFLITGHGLADTNIVRVKAGPDSRLPAPLRNDISYTVMLQDANTLELQDNGNTVDVTDYGAGTYFMYRNPLTHWHTALEL